MVRKQSAISWEGARRGLGQPSLRLANRKGRDREEVPVGELWPSAKSGLLPILFSQGAIQIFTLLNGWETEYFVTTRNSDFGIHKKVLSEQSRTRWFTQRLFVLVLQQQNCIKVTEVAWS